MTIPLTDDQRRALAEAGDSPPTLTDPATDTEYVLVRADVYATLRAVADGVAKRAGWGDPRWTTRSGIGNESRGCRTR